MIRALLNYPSQARLSAEAAGDAQTDSDVKTLATLLRVDLTGITGIVGRTCSPISVVLVFLHSILKL